MNPQTEVSNGSGDPVPGDDLVADGMARNHVRAPADVGFSYASDAEAAPETPTGEFRPGLAPDDAADAEA